MKIAMISPFFVRCGISSYTMNLSKALADLGCEVLGIRLPRFGAKSPEILQNLVDSIPVDRVDLVHVQHEYGLYSNLEGGYCAALKRLGLPLIFTLHAIGSWELDRVIASVSDRIIVHNAFCARRLGHPCVIIPHGCMPSKTVPAEEAKRGLGIDPRAPIVGYAGFISTYKGIETLVEAMAKVPNAALLIAGGWHAGPGTEYSMNLKRWSLSLLPGRCQWLGWVPDERLATVYGAMQIAVYPSIFITESGALLMALSHGKAVIASDLPAVKEKAKLGALMTFKSRNVKDLRRKIKRLLKDEDLRMKLEEGARKFAEGNSWEKIARLHLSLYEDVIERKAKQ